VCNHQIPALVEDFEDVPLVVDAGALRGQQIAARGDVAKSGKGVANDAGVFAGD
jgi:hypothetical protein